MVRAPVVRPARDDDSGGVIELIASVYAEYPNCILDVDGEEPELRRPASSYPWFQVASWSGRIIGCVGLKAVDDGLRLVKLYVHASARGIGLGGQLVRLAEDEARRRGASELDLWTDTRFETAHRVYEKLGYEPTGETRELHDLSATVEYRYRKTL